MKHFFRLKSVVRSLKCSRLRKPIQQTAIHFVIEFESPRLSGLVTELKDCGPAVYRFVPLTGN
jgi:hypothetical protein